MLAEEPLFKCAVYELDIAAATGLQLHPAHRPCGWDQHQFASEEWLDKAVRRSRLLVSDASRADVILLTRHSFSLWCHRQRQVSYDMLKAKDPGRRQAGVACQKMAEGHEVPQALAYAPPARSSNVHGAGGTADARGDQSGGVPSTSFLSCNPGLKAAVWQRTVEMLHFLGRSESARYGNKSVPAVLSLTNNECGPPWANRVLPGHILTQMVQSRRPRPFDVVVPLALSSPDWLVGYAHALPPELLPWTSRKLLFFGGHVPKLYVSQTRFRLWQQLRQHDSDVTVISSTINCTVGAYDICAAPERIVAEYSSFCDEPCKRTPTSRISKTRCASSPGQLRTICKSYTQVPWAAERAAMSASTRYLPREDFLRIATRHRFFLVSPGDFLSTRKISEAMALGGAAGVVPVFVVPEQHAAFHPKYRGDYRYHGGAKMLPYTRWLQYCRAAYFVNEADVTHNASLLLQQLHAVSRSEVRAKQHELRRVWSAFSFRDPERDGGAAAQPSAADYLLSEACAAARRFSADHRHHGNDLQAAPRTRYLGDCTFGSGLPLTPTCCRKLHFDGPNRRRSASTQRRRGATS